ncbi:MAG: hypothetical protein CVT48_03030 [Thermoplasmata archaeon HGW-Thermoplasmata-1]|nr:MAG: hypothetical protein CVT48_03030 [Thermoplasmata archaeon HGW-Thermoplasmata-1]
MNYSLCNIHCKNDLEFLKNDKTLDSFLKLLSDFGKSSRYYNINMICGAPANTDSPYNLIDEIEENLLKDGTCENLNECLKKLCNKFTRALSRFFTYGDLKQFGGAFNHVLDFAKLTDSEI